MIRQARHVAGLGPIAATISAGAVVRIELGRLEAEIGSEAEMASALPDAQDSLLLGLLFAELEQYAQGKRHAFTVPWRLEGMTAFTELVLKACAEIPFGETITYGQLAHRIENLGAVRAVGGALGRNPLPILIPCHRVLAGNGIGGFSGGLEWKRRLLGVEGLCDPSESLPCLHAQIAGC